MSVSERENGRAVEEEEKPIMNYELQKTENKVPMIRQKRWEIISVTKINDAEGCAEISHAQARWNEKNSKSEKISFINNDFDACPIYNTIPFQRATIIQSVSLLPGFWVAFEIYENQARISGIFMVHLSCKDAIINQKHLLIVVGKWSSDVSLQGVVEWDHEVGHGFASLTIHINDPTT